MNDDYVVKSGDTLSKIAAEHHTNARELAAVNRISNINYIRVGQILQIPVPLFDIPALPELKLPEIDLSSMLALEFFDAANKPINGMKVNVQVADKVVKHKTDAAGKIPLIAAKKNETVQVHVEKVKGGPKKVSEVKIDAAATYARVISPKIQVKSQLKVHEGPAQTPKTVKPKPTEVGTETITRSAAGNPVHGVALECPNPENLKLLANAKYRDVIIAAGKRSEFTPQAIAAIMNAEAATISYKFQVPVMNKKTGKPAVGKDGKPVFKTIPKNDGEWNTRSASPKSSARGMTQFLDASWIDMALASGTLLNDRIKKEGWPTTTTILIKKKKKKKTKDEKDEFREVTVDAFKLANGKLAAATLERSLVKVLSSKPYITARATSSDANLQKLLDLRYEPEYAINTAVDYGLQNLRGLKKAGFKIDGLSDGDRAKLVYLTHHLGLGDAQGFINNTIGNSHAKYLLETQVGVESAAEYAAANDNSYVKGHRAWLLKYVDKKIVLVEKMCDASKATAVRHLLDITVAIRS
ncbi:MAG: LysM peptidoglycan-binding domain-containing protein [Telluria sp.]